MNNLYGKIFLILSVFAISIHLSGCSLLKDKVAELERQRAQRTEELIKTSPDFQAVDDLCNQIPIPETSTFIVKSIGTENVIDITYCYFSPDKYENLKKFYITYFGDNEWQITSDDVGIVTKITKFKKGQFSVTMQVGGIGDANANYAFDCKKLPNLGKDD